MGSSTVDVKVEQFVWIEILLALYIPFPVLKTHWEYAIFDTEQRT